MNFKTFGNDVAPLLMLIPGLGVSYEIFLPLVDLLKNRFLIVAVEIDGFTIAEKSSHTAAPKRFLTDISQSIQTDWNQSPILRFTFGMARKKQKINKVTPDEL